MTTRRLSASDHARVLEWLAFVRGQDPNFADAPPRPDFEVWQEVRRRRLYGVSRFDDARYLRHQEHELAMLIERVRRAHR